MIFEKTNGNKVLSLGELLLRVCFDESDKWLQDNLLPFYVGGAEVNVATALSLWDIPSAIFTALPDNNMSKGIIQYLTDLSIDTSPIQLSGERLGLYYLEKGKDLKNAGVIYDRANSSFATLNRVSIDWNKIFEDVSWLHLSAICPAISQNVANICLDAVKIAKKLGIFVSFDLNFRSKLWKYGKLPIDIIPNLLQHCDLIMGNVWAAHQMAGTSLQKTFLSSGPYEHEELIKQAEQTSQEMMEKYPQCKVVANTFRFDNGEGIRYFTTLYSDGELTISSIWEKEKILDKVGSGDCFMAGLIYGFYNQSSSLDTLEFATAAAVAKLDIPSDATTSKVEDIYKLIKNKK